MFMGCRQIVVVHAPDILHLQEFEDIVNTQRDFPIGMMGVDDVAAIREVHEQGATCILG